MSEWGLASEKVDICGFISKEELEDSQDSKANKLRQSKTFEWGVPKAEVFEIADPTHYGKQKVDNERVSYYNHWRGNQRGKTWEYNAEKCDIDTGEYFGEHECIDNLCYSLFASKESDMPSAIKTDFDQVLSLDSGMNELHQNSSMIVEPEVPYEDVEVQGIKGDLQCASDVVVDVVCTPCEGDGLREEAQKYCSTCKEHLCSTCARCHQRMKATKEHTLIELPYGNNGPSQKFVKCWYHMDRNIEMYCKTHDMVYCARCIATEHRSCEGITDVENIAGEGNNIRDVQKMQEESKLIYDQLVACNKKKDKELTETENHYTTASRKIGTTKQKLIKHVEGLVTNAIRALQKAKVDIKNDIEADKCHIGKIIETIEERNRKLEKACQMGEVQRFIEVKLSKMATGNAREFFEQTDSESTKVINITENENMIDSIMTEENLFTICTLEQ